jgi:hypothetical protein
VRQVLPQAQGSWRPYVCVCVEHSRLKAVCVWGGATSSWASVRVARQGKRKAWWARVGILPLVLLRICQGLIGWAGRGLGGLAGELAVWPDKCSST